MTRYGSLTQYLLSLPGDHWRASFAEIERVIGNELPQSARQYPAWWANQRGSGHSQKLGWLNAGWETSQLNLKNETVTFVRVRPTAANHIEGSAYSEHGLSRQGLSIAEAKVKLSAYYDIPANKIEITMRG